MRVMILKRMVLQDRVFAKPMVCQTYGGLHENDGNHEDDKDNTDSHKQEG